MRQRLATTLLVAAVITPSGGVAQSPPTAATLPANDLQKARTMLREGYETVKKEYYDPAFHGVDLDARYTEYDKTLRTVPSMSVALTVIAGFLDGLKDSHTAFQPPARSFTIDYGYRLAVVGDGVFVERVKPATDAASKVRAGDKVLLVNGGGVSRESFHRMQYLLNVLQPQPSLRLTLVDPAGLERAVSIETAITPGRAVRNLSGAGAGLELQEMELAAEAEQYRLRHRHVEQGDVMIWKMPVFLSENGEIDRMFATARKAKTLILDLRGNPGGRVDTLRRMVGNLFPADVTIGTRVTRKGRSPLVAKSRGAEAFGGRLIVLVDAASGSSAEILARVVQLGHRGTVIGDQSAGAVMEARQFPFGQMAPTLILYGFLVTDADLLMTDGHSLEGHGVIPDERVLPTGADLAAGRDPALGRAFALAGLALDAVAAGKLFPFEWK